MINNKTKKWEMDLDQIRDLIYNQQQRQHEMLKGYKLEKKDNTKNNKT